MNDRIIQEAINLIHEKGFSFTISDLVRNLGTSKRTIYQYFDSKDSIIEAIIEELISEIKQKEQHIYNNEDLSLIEKIRELLICIPEEFQIMDFRLLIQLKKLHYNQWEKLNNFISHEWDIVIELMERGIKEGKIRKINIQLFIELYLGAINQIYDAKFSLKNCLTMSQILNSAIDILLNGIYVE